jgi:hypothetical protein
MKPNWLQIVLPHVYAVLIFLGLSLLFSSPVLEGLELRQHDNVQWKAMSQEARAYQEETGVDPLWTNAMFGGMPTYQIMMVQDNYIYTIQQILTFGLPKPVNFLFLSMLGFYFLMCVMSFRSWIRIAGAVAFGFASYHMMIIAAGHDTKMLTMAYMAPTLAGILLTYRGKYLLGGITTALSLCLMLTNGHYQIVYYLLFMCLVVAIGHFIIAYKQKSLPTFFKASAVLVVFGFLAVLPTTVSVWTTYEYAKHTMRGGHSELTPEPGAENNTSDGGLNKDYAFQWSQGPFETLTILVPNLYGGGSSGGLNTQSETYKLLTQVGMPANQATQFVEQQVPVYWGPQPMTDGAIYWGAVMLFLFVLGFFIIASPHKWWILAACLLGAFLAWGSHFSMLNYFLFDHFPFFNKFRAPAQALVLPQLLVPFFACWSINEWVNRLSEKSFLWEQLKKTFYITGGLTLLLLVASWGMLDFTSATDVSKNYYAQLSGGNAQLSQQLMDALIADRASLLQADAFRTLFLLILTAGLLWLMLNQKMKINTALIVLVLLVAADLILIDKRYLNKDNYVTQRDYANIFQPSAIDLAIKQDSDPYYRVLNTSQFGDALVSYHHKSVGGYSPVKLARYQDLIDRQISQNNQQVLNMLNTKYIIYRDNQGQPGFMRNPDALGNAWFVDSLVWAQNPDEEMAALTSLPVAHAAVIDKRFDQNGLGQFIPQRDSSAQIQLKKYGLNELQFVSKNALDGFAVFSDIYYADGWKAFIDGSPAELVRVNYVLRGMRIPAGSHQIEMRFEPRSYYTGNMISRWSSIFLYLILVGAVLMEFKRR